MMSDLWQRFQREVKANKGKAGLLAALFLFGCCFWLPMLTRAATTKRAVPANGAATIAPPVVPPGVDLPQNAESGRELNPEKFWSNLAQSLDVDPMFQSAAVPSTLRDPFQPIDTSEPLPVLFADEPKPKVEVAEVKKPQEMKLSSTIIGKSRRAAMINGQLYQLGRRIQAEGREYLLTKIESHRVVLSSGGQSIELTLARPQLKDVLNRRELADPPLQ